MLLAKTSKARSCLLERPTELNVFERRILILSDGKREREEIVGMLGQTSRALIDELLQEDYLVAVPEPVSSAASPRSTVTTLIRALATTTMATAAQPSNEPFESPVEAPGTVPSQPARAHAGAAGSRRSMAATRMYMVDMLQLQRTQEAADLKRVLQTCTDPDELICNVLAALACIRGATSPSYGQRVAERLAEVLPEQHLTQLLAQDARIASSPESA